MTELLSFISFSRSRGMEKRTAKSGRGYEVNEKSYVRETYPFCQPPSAPSLGVRENEKTKKVPSPITGPGRRVVPASGLARRWSVLLAGRFF